MLNCIARWPIVIGLILILAVTVHTQDRDTLDRNMLFFQKKAIEYQYWLDVTGLGHNLRVDEVRIQPQPYDPTALELLLELRATNLDTAVNTWLQMKRTFDRMLGGQETLEEKLFRTFVHKMEIGHRQGNIQVYVRNPQGAYYRCFRVWVWQDEGAIQTETLLNDCRARDLPILHIQSGSVVKKIGRGKTSIIYRRDKPEEVFRKILDFAHQRYEEDPRYQGICKGRTPKVEEVEQNSNTLSFIATNLCREVLTDEEKSIWCKAVELIGQNCNDIGRERLTFRFTYAPTDRGYALQCRLEGLFGSGTYRPRSGAYMDMEPDFTDYLNKYVKNFYNALKAHLDLRP